MVFLVVSLGHNLPKVKSIYLNKSIYPWSTCLKSTLKMTYTFFKAANVK